jgi:hypothetical protein
MWTRLLPRTPMALAAPASYATGGQARMRRRAQGTPSRTDAFTASTAFTLSRPSSQSYTDALATQLLATQRNALPARLPALSPCHWAPAAALTNPQSHVAT